MNFTRPEILEAFQYAKVAHEKSAKQLEEQFGKSLTVIDPFSKGNGDACYIIDEGERLVIAFPGSNDIVDWILNFYKFHEVESGMHKGIKLGLETMVDEIVANLVDKNPDKVLITGVSRGGALADAFLELYTAVLANAEIDCITFAQPRVFTNDHYKNLLTVKSAANVRYLRVHMANDVVPKIPPSKYGYTHRGESLRLGKKLSWWKQLRSAWKARRETGEYALAGFDEHKIDVHEKHLKKLK
ncbi:MAG: hypothetical protein GWN00_19785 [Aliifodinibius sp.]|nr:lipase family protein [Fodinibius sp.]NIY26964.1 hypothetical protein [Fodinibius sp.]